MALIALKCPNCGAMLPHQSMTCEYCGANLTLSADKASFIPQNTTSCPKCSNIVATGAWFCAKCGQVLTPDTEHLKQIQKKVLFVQQNLRTNYPEVSFLLEPNEFIYFLFHNKGLVMNSYYVATDKRLLIFNARKKEAAQALLSEIVGHWKALFYWFSALHTLV